MHGRPNLRAVCLQGDWEYSRPSHVGTNLREGEQERWQPIYIVFSGYCC